MANKRPGSFTGLVRLTKQKVLDGLPGPGGVRIRYALPGEAGAVTALLMTAGDDMKPAISKHLPMGGAGRGC